MDSNTITQRRNFSDRIEVFGELTVADMKLGIDTSKFDALLGEYYDQFVDFFEAIQPRAKEISTISCIIGPDGLDFRVIYI